MLSIQVVKHKDPRDACAAIVAESYRSWLQYETRTDDITVIVVHVNGLTDVRRDFMPCVTFSVILRFSIFISYISKLLLITSCLHVGCSWSISILGSSFKNPFTPSG